MSCFPPADPFFAVAVAAAIMAVHSPSLDRHQDKRLLLERERAELRASIEDPAWMRDHGRATLARLSVERRSEEHTSELQSLMRISYAVFCLKKKKKKHVNTK